MSALAIEGFASLFNREDLGGDIVLPGAFASLDTAVRPVPMLYQHEPGEPIGRWQVIEQRQAGLWVEGEIFDVTARARSVQALVRCGALSGLSIGFKTRTAGPRPRGGRFLAGIELWEVSIVTFPMLPQARLQLAKPQERAA